MTLGTPDGLAPTVAEHRIVERPLDLPIIITIPAEEAP